jgi:hypothetical protein
MTEPDEALEGFRKWASIRYPKVAAYIEAGACDGDDTAEAYRAGQAASAERIKALEEELAVALMQVSLWAQARRYQIGGIPTTDAFRPRTLLKEAGQ